ncbi:MAG: Maf family protein [Armatimonadota bacterium]
MTEPAPAPGTPGTLILASASPRRQELIRLLRIPFEVLPSAYEEHLPERHPSPGALAEHLAAAKAIDVARRHRQTWVLGADTVVALGDRIYGKPADEVDGARMLRELSGRTHQVMTGVALVRLDERDPVTRTFHAVTDVTFRELAEEEIAAYLRTGEPSDKAGAYAIQGYGGLLIREIRGDYPNVVGLPLTPLALLLRELGWSILE